MFDHDTSRTSSIVEPFRGGKPVDRDDQCGRVEQRNEADRSRVSLLI